jgi:TRAP-type mannitol/chloroaromatic compound transport system substrate-binding protein
MIIVTGLRLVFAFTALLLSSVAAAGPVDIVYRSFSASAAIGPPADVFAADLRDVTRVSLGPSNEVRFVRLPGTPSIPARFAGDIMSAVSASAAHGGFDAAYVSGSDLNRAWGFIVNSGVPFGPTFDEFLGFLYGRNLVQELLDQRGRNVVAIPIVGSTEQLSGYFPEPIGDVRGRRGIGLTGLCEQHWVLRYLPPGENVINQACDDLVASGYIRHKNLSFIQAVAGGGSLVDAVKAGTLNGFEFATPLDDVSQLFGSADNPTTVGIRYVHAPGWHQQFLITWMVINRQVWSSLSAGQRVMIATEARWSVLSSYAQNMRQQGPALKVILDSGVVMSQWPARDLARLRDATIKAVNARATDQSLSAADRSDYSRVLEALRIYVRANAAYWDTAIDTHGRFSGWEGWTP